LVCISSAPLHSLTTDHPFFSHSIDLNYQDPRPESVRKAEEAHRDSLRETRERLEREWEDEKRAAQEAQPPLPEPRKSAALLAAEGAEKTFEIGNEEGSGVQPNWDESPIEVSCCCYPMLRRRANDLDSSVGNLVARSSYAERL
jgi:hypothetical protein